MGFCYAFVHVVLNMHCDYCTCTCIYMYTYFSTVGSQLSELWLSIKENLDVTTFSAAVGKDVPVTRVLQQKKEKLLYMYERLFPNATTPFSSSTGFRSQFTMSKLSEVAHAVVHCITVRQIKRRGK